ncbi:MAG: amidohydrolase family protein, partial [Thermacetogeniaceae bacterium]
QAACAAYEDGADREEVSYLELLSGGQGCFGGLPFQEKVRRLTSLPAQLFGLRERGEIAPGYYADILVLKRQGNGYAVEYVFVSGRPVVIEGHISGFKAGCLLLRDKH